MKFLLKFTALLILAMPVCLFISCSDDDDDNSGDKPTEEKLYIKELYDKKGDVMTFDYDSKNRITKVALYDDGEYWFVDLAHNPLKMKTYRLGDIDSEVNEESLYDDGDLARVSSIKTNKSGNITSCVVTKKEGTARANVEYDSEQHPVKLTQVYEGEDWSSTDVAELTWKDGNLIHYTVTDETGLYLESILEYTNYKNLTEQPTYAMTLALWGRPEFFSGVLGKTSKNLPSKLTTKYYEDGSLEETNVYNLSYSFGDNNDVAEEYLENDEETFWISHLAQHLNHYEVYYGYTK